MKNVLKLPGYKKKINETVHTLKFRSLLGIEAKIRIYGY